MLQIATIAQMDGTARLEHQLTTYVNTDDLLTELALEWEGKDFEEIRIRVARAINTFKGQFIQTHHHDELSDTDIAQFRDDLTKKILQKLEQLESKGLLEAHAHDHDHDHGHDHRHDNDLDPSLRILNGPCVNMDFENCDFTGWDMTEGDVDGNPFNYINVTPTTNWSTYPAGTGADQHFIVNGGTDAVTGMPMVNPDGGTCSAVIGDFTGTGYRAASISQPFLVDAGNANFTYSYAVVLQDPSHTVGEQPFFRIRMYDEFGNSIPCAEFEVYAADGHPDWQVTGTTNYIPWQTAFIPLQAYIGQNVTIEFTVGDCGQGGHYGYAYVDASCAPMEIIPSDTIVCAGVPVTLTAPAGGASYSWSTGETTQSITVSAGGNYTVDVMAVSGCVISLDVDVYQGDEPTADFVSTIECLGNPTAFTDQSFGPNGITDWAWDFDGDGVVDDVSANPSHVFPGAGTYPINLQVTDASGCIHDITLNAVVEDQPTADFVSTTVCEGTVSGYTDLSTTTTGTITSWEWDFDSNGSVDNTTQNPTNGFGSAGTYSTTLTVTTAGGCTDNVTYPVVVNPVPSADFLTTEVCLGEASGYTDVSSISSGSIASWQWDFGDGIGTSTTQNPSYTYGSAGNYSVQLTVTSDNGCINTVTLPLIVNDQPTAAFVATDVCLDAAAAFTDMSTITGSGSIASWEWDIDGDGTTDYTSQNPSNSYLSDGTYNVQLVVSTTAGCSDTVTGPVTIFPMPNADFSFSNVCLGGSITFTDNSTVSSGSISGWSWDFGNSTTSTLQDPSETYGSEGLFNVDLIVTTDNGCTDQISYQAEVWPLPNADFSPTAVCLNSPTAFNDLSAVSNLYTTNTITDWAWDFGDGNTATGSSPMNTYTADGTYNASLTVTTNNGCVGTITQPVTVHPNPVVNFASTDPNGCSVWCVDFSEAVTINSGGITNYLWDFGDGTVSTDANPQHCYENNTQLPQTYDISLIATSDQGCTSDSTAVAYVTVFPLPIAAFDYGPTDLDEYNAHVEFVDQSIGAATWTWDFGDGNSSNTQNPEHTYGGAGSYDVTLYITNVYGCTDQVTHPIEVKPESGIYVPNTITANGDGLNDIFYAKGFNIVEFEMLIFNRWGELVYQAEDMNRGWDGSYRGTTVQEDVYVWKINATDINNEKIELYGHVTVVR